MFRRVIILFLGVGLTSLYSVSQDSSAPQAQSTNPSQTSSPGQSQNTAASPTQNTSASQAQSSSQTNPPSTHKQKQKKSKKAVNPIANLDSKQPDKVLFDRAEDAIKHGKYDVARLSLQTLINTYPDSEYVARAKLAIGDSWYQEGGTAAMAQAESEYKDFITFFPNMPEAAEAQMKIANIHFSEMEKADRDPTHARRAEEEYRQMIMQFPDSSLVPEAKQRLLEVQEVLADREYIIGHFYFMRESYPAAIARLKSVADTYPLYSGADIALFELGTAYEREVEVIRRSRLPETAKGNLIKQYNQGAVEAYDRILTRYPLESEAREAKKRLIALKQPVPQATPEAIAQDKAEIASRGSLGTVGKVMENFHKGPDVSEAARVGEPTLVDPKQASAPDMIRAANASVTGVLEGAGGGNKVSVEQIHDGGAPAENAAVPRSDAASGAATPAADPASGAAPAPGDAPAGTDMKNDMAATGNGAAPAPPPTQVNEVAGANTSSSSSAASSSSTAPAADSNTESSSKKKKKKHLLLF
jgi:outer membrane protein assembly factor BamD